MNGVGGVADQRQAVDGVAMRVAERQRERGARAERFDFPQVVAEGRLQARKEGRIVERQQFIGQGIVRRPDDRTGVGIGEWQERERAGGQEALAGGFFVRFLGADSGDDALLVKAQALGVDAGGAAGGGIGAVGADDQPRPEYSPVLE